MPDPTTSEPTELTAGVSYAWTRAVASEFAPGSVYTAKCYLRGDSTLDLTGTASSGLWRFDLSAAQSLTLAAGSYTWHCVAESGSGATLARYPLADGRLTVLVDPLTLPAGDRRTHAEIALALAEAQYRDLLATPVESYTIGQRQATRRTLADLSAEIAKLKRQVARERNDGKSPAVTFRFARA